MSSTSRSTSAGSSPSAITRISGSVPDLRMTSRPRPCELGLGGGDALLDAVGLERRLPPLKRTFFSSCGTGSNWWSTSLAGLPASTSAASTCSAGDQPVAGGRMVAEDDVPRLLAADVARLLAHRLEHVAVADLGADAGRCPPSASLRSSPRLDMTVATTAPPLKLAAALQVERDQRHQLVAVDDPARSRRRRSGGRRRRRARGRCRRRWRPPFPAAAADGSSRSRR